MNEQTPYYPQLEERDCGATCLRMVAERYGIVVSMEHLREVTSTDARGTDLGGLERGAQALGFETLAAEIPFDELTVGDFLPVILHWDRDHFVVVTEASYDGVTILDPASGKRKLSRDDFEQHRYGPGKSRAGLILRPLPQARKQTNRDLSANNTSAGDYTSQESGAKRPAIIGIIFSSLLFVAALAAGVWVIKTAVFQAIDLQYREGWLQHLGAMLLASAGIALASYLLRKQAIAFASVKGSLEVQKLVAHTRARAADVSKPLEADNYLRLLSDSDDLRVWYSNGLSTLIMGVALVCCALGYLFAIDVSWGAALLICLVLLALASYYVDKQAQRNRESGIEAQLKQRESMYEYVKLLPEVQPLGGEKFLTRRLTSSNENAEISFKQIASEHAAQNQLVEVAMLLSVVGLLSFGFYQLGFAGLQVGELALGFLLIFACLLPFFPISKAFNAWRKLLPARLRLADISPVPQRSSRPGFSPQAITIAWKTPKGEEQQFTFPPACSLALVGSDEATKQALILALQGRPNTLGAQVYFDGITEKKQNLSALGKFTVLSQNSYLAKGKLAKSIALTDRPDLYRLDEAARIAGIATDNSQQGLNADVGFNGEGLDSATTIRALIARAVYHDTTALILDKLTSALPAYEEGILMDQLLTWSQGKLLILHPERMNAAYGCDILVHLEEGEIAAIGDHETLLQERGAYYYQVAASQHRLP